MLSIPFLLILSDFIGSDHPLFSSARIRRCYAFGDRHYDVLEDGIALCCQNCTGYFPHISPAQRHHMRRYFTFFVFVCCFLVLHVVALVCPQWQLSNHIRISTDAVTYGTEATVSCDEGFIFPDGSVQKAIKCVAIAAGNPEAVWDTMSLSCTRKSYRRDQL